MKFRPTSCRSCAASGFTLTEVLAALVFMAIVIPVAVQGLRTASLAGQVGMRKEVAMRVAERVLNEYLLASSALGSARNGVLTEGIQPFRWSLRTEPWARDDMNLITVQVVFPVQGQEYDVQLSTLVDTDTQ